jgi:hypothetical protein
MIIRPSTQKQNVTEQLSSFLTTLVISIDGEYFQISGSEVRLLSLQYCALHNDKMCSGIIPIERGEERPTFTKFIRAAIEDAIKSGVLEVWPEKLIVCAHFLRADLMHFSNAFLDFDGKLHAVRNTMVSMEETYGMEVELTKYQREKLRKTKGEADNKSNATIGTDAFSIYDKNRNYHKVEIKFYDTMLIAPTGQTLASIGELMGVPKIDIPEPYSIERMDVFQDEEPKKIRRICH